MKISCDKVSDALYVKLTDKKVARTKQVEDGIAIDFDAGNGIIGIEILYASRREINPYEITCQYFEADQVNAISVDNASA